MTYTVGIYLFDEVEVLDFAGPFEVFSTASRVRSRRQPDAPLPFEVVLISDRPRLISARAGLRVQTEFGIANHPPLDVLLVPGGVVTAELQRPEIIAWIASVSAQTTLTASVCTGAFLLGQAGLLEGRMVTTHWEDIAELREMFPAVQVKEQTRWVDGDRIVTSAGISAGIDMSLHLVARLDSPELAHQTAKQMEFDWVCNP